MNAPAGNAQLGRPALVLLAEPKRASICSPAELDWAARISTSLNSDYDQTVFTGSEGSFTLGGALSWTHGSARLDAATYYQRWKYVYFQQPEEIPNVRGYYGDVSYAFGRCLTVRGAREHGRLRAALDAGHRDLLELDCHGNPPPAPHPQNASCHAMTVTATGQIDVAGGHHIDGVLDVAAPLESASLTRT